MDLKEVKRIIQMVEEAQITHLSIESEGTKIEVKKEWAQAHSFTQVMSPSHTGHLSAPSTVEHPSTPAAAVVAQKDDKLVAIKSQMVGTFYSSSKPDSPPLIKVGDTISQGTVLCIVEAMKLFNEIEAEISGTIEKVCVSNAEPVEYGQELFLVRIS